MNKASENYANAIEKIVGERDLERMLGYLHKHLTREHDCNNLKTLNEMKVQFNGGSAGLYFFPDDVEEIYMSYLSMNKSQLEGLPKVPKKFLKKKSDIKNICWDGEQWLLIK